MRKLWLRLFDLSLRHLRNHTNFSGSRITSEFTEGTRFIQVTTRDINKPNIYGREDVLKMLHVVRLNEARMNWKCPEPVLATCSCEGGSDGDCDEHGKMPRK